MSVKVQQDLAKGVDQDKGVDQGKVVDQDKGVDLAKEVDQGKEVLSVQWMTAVNCVEVFQEERPETLPQVAL